jgi:hypothetical protein
MFNLPYQRTQAGLFLRAHIILLSCERAMRDAAIARTCQYRRLLA